MLLVVWRLFFRQAGGGLLVVLILLAVAPIKLVRAERDHGDTEQSPTYRRRSGGVSGRESAALWLGQNSAPTDVVADQHLVPPGREADARV